MKTDYRLQMMHQIAVNTTYICYGLKQGPIRALNKNTAGRVLFKDHASMVIDMRFFSASSNVLASIDQSGDVIVRKVRLLTSMGLGMSLIAALPAITDHN